MLSKIVFSVVYITMEKKKKKDHQEYTEPESAVFTIYFESIQQSKYTYYIAYKCKIYFSALKKF